MGLSINIGRFKKGKKNSITDVEGVAVGHVTLNGEGQNTGVTAIIPKKNIFKEKLVAGVHVINGFAKPAGLVQIEELGTLEAPIILTNTLSVGNALTASVKYMLSNNPEIGRTTGTVNCPVLECNDMRLNDIRALHVKEKDVLKAIESAGDIVEEGAVGAGRGMRCHELKGGIGTASRIVNIGEDYTVGVLVLTNHAKYDELTIEGVNIKDYRDNLNNERTNCSKEKEQGSIIVIIATDIPLSSRQLKRVAKRAMSGISRTGANSGNGSGEVAVAFSTCNKILHDGGNFTEVKCLLDDKIDPVFNATIDAVHEAILSSMLHAESMVGYSGFKAESLRDILKEISLFENYLP